MREEVREYKKSRILEVALQLFFENGFESTSIDRIAKELGVTKPFVYSYFPSKIAILESIYEKSSERLRDAINEELQSEGPVTVRLHRFIVIFVRENIDYQAASAIYLQEEKRISKEQTAKIRKIEKSFDGLLTQLINRGIDEGKFDVPDVKLASLAISGMVRWVHRWYRVGGRLSPEETAEGVADLALRMLGAKPSD